LKQNLNLILEHIYSTTEFSKHFTWSCIFDVFDPFREANLSWLIDLHCLLLPWQLHMCSKTESPQYKPSIHRFHVFAVVKSAAAMSPILFLCRGQICRDNNSRMPACYCSFDSTVNWRQQRDSARRDFLIKLRNQQFSFLKEINQNHMLYDPPTIEE
jgi:hypothetical protein